MMHLFRQWIIGGQTGSREGVWFLVLVLTVIPFFALAVAEWLGRPMPNAWGALMVLGPAALGLWSLAHGLEKAKEAGWRRKGQGGADGPE